jgi:hypothetical protein
MIQVGDLVKGASTGKIGVVIGRDLTCTNYYYVLFHDNTYTIHKNNIEPLETK